jgi:hypothetical protein
MGGTAIKAVELSRQWVGATVLLVTMNDPIVRSRLRSSLRSSLGLAWASRRCSVVFCSTLLLLTPLSLLPAVARGGGGGGGSFHGGGRGGGYHNNRVGDHPMYGGGTRNSFNNDRVNVNVHNNFYNRGYGGWHEGWRNGGYWGARPWNAGWYRGWGGWGWWGANAAAWGVAGLATGAAITSLVNTAADQQSTVIVVPQTEYQLNFGTVESVGDAGVSFSYGLGNTDLMGSANCQSGLLNGQVPSTADQAQLLNAVCQVAYGSGS